MKFLCECGHAIYDQTDYLSYKAYLISDQDWFSFLDEIDNAIEKTGSTPEDKEKALMRIRSIAINLTKLVYQCDKCGNIFFYNSPPQLEMFRSCSDTPNKGLLKSAKGVN
ncbi:hypothetical protein QFZ81_003072 [Paenibacillus sp. V4I9]|uniref:hypothetical protein n=1 Tax=Paenibacillus sp. V4I9 TaxID=3042308 RepID=UPI00277D8101|nr:hypothetical protein [Paenibacillus sp. V4I9]MDQ0887984.1 hypothetical protein [Paenibacillus sp. V4I9]